MRKILLSLIALSAILTSCSSTAPVKKSVAYKGMYEEKPVSVLIMPPINRTTNVEAKEFFHATLMAPLASKGFYIIPPFMSMDILKRESAYDSELFLDSGLSKFQEVFGADTALFTIIHKWNKGISQVNVEVEYILKSTKTNQVLFTRRGTINYDSSVNTGAGGLAGLIANVALSAANNAGTKKYVDAALACNLYTFSDIPVGKYSPENPLEKDQNAAKKEFRATVKAGSVRM